MATSITTQADLLDYGFVTDNEIVSLQTDRMEKTSWSTLHQRAWSKCLDLLALQPRFSSTADSDIESMLSDTDELKPAVVYLVMYYAYAQAEFMSDENQKRADRYWERAIKELNEVRLTINGLMSDRAAYTHRRASRA